jgi:hypothetical protein
MSQIFVLKRLISFTFSQTRVVALSYFQPLSKFHITLTKIFILCMKCTTYLFILRLETTLSRHPKWSSWPMALEWTNRGWDRLETSHQMLGNYRIASSHTSSSIIVIAPLGAPMLWAYFLVSLCHLDPILITWRHWPTCRTHNFLFDNVSSKLGCKATYYKFLVFCSSRERKLVVLAKSNIPLHEHTRKKK